jgi:hypothetical protein
MLVTVYGFDAGNVTIAVCGNSARRGSSDCNMTESSGLTVPPELATSGLEMPVAEPPMPCPCLVRVSSASNDEVAVAALTIVGHPIAPVVGESEPVDALGVSIVAAPREGGLVDGLQASLGGPVAYDVTVTVRNRGTSDVVGVRAAGALTRGGSEIDSLDLTDPGTIGAGQTWQETVVAEVPTPSWGNMEWRVDVTGAGPPVSATTSTSNTPWLLWVLVIVLVVDIVVLVTRLVIRRLRAERDEAPEPDIADVDTELDDQLVGSSH